MRQREAELLQSLTLESRVAPPGQDRGQLHLPGQGRWLPRLFQRFVRGSTPAAGSGLGLSIARLVVEAHGGTIAYFVPEAGAVRFAVRLPCRRP